MKAIDVLNILKGYSPVSIAPTVDTVKHGDPEREAHRIAFCFTATADVLAEAKKWGADVIVTHEPTYYDHFDNFAPNALTQRKLDAVTACDAVIMRYHDHMHACVPDLIHKAFIDKTGLDGEYDGSRMMRLKSVLTVKQLAEMLKKAFGLDIITLIGDKNAEISTLALCPGACGDACQKAALDGADAVIAGEISEWRTGEQFRDMAQFGMGKAIILIGHCTSEKTGMQALCERFAKEHTQTECRYIDCGDIYTYI